MDCREFREKHVGYVDDTLSAVEMEAMHRHVRSCYRCARQDTAVRRGLLLVHNLPQIEPSSDFMAKLSDRIAELEAAGHDVEISSPYHLTSGAFVALAAGLTLFGITLLKVMLFDISELHQFYRILAFLALGVALLAVAWGYQRVRRA